MAGKAPGNALSLRLPAFQGLQGGFIIYDGGQETEGEFRQRERNRMNKTLRRLARRPIGQVEEILSHSMCQTRSRLRNHNGNHKIGRGTRDIDTLIGRRSGEQEKGMFLPLFSSRIFPFCFQYFHLLSPTTPCGTSLTALIFTLYINFYHLYFSSAQSRKQK